MNYSTAKTIVNNYDKLAKKLHDISSEKARVEEMIGLSVVGQRAIEVIRSQEATIRLHHSAIASFEDGIKRNYREIKRQKSIITNERDKKIRDEENLAHIRKRIKLLEAKIAPLKAKIDLAQERVTRHKQKIEQRVFRAEVVGEEHGE